jgi:hypothetical protein
MPAEVVGVKDVLAGLEFINEDLRQRIRIAIEPTMRSIAQTTRNMVPVNNQVLSGWVKPLSSNVQYRSFPKYDASMIRSRIGFDPGENKTLPNGFKISNYVYNASPAGAIYETAGRLNPNGRAPFQMTPSQGASGTYTLKSPKSKALKEYKSNNPFASQQFIAALEPVTRQPKIKGVRSGNRKTSGRLLYKVWAQESDKVYNRIVKSINGAVTHFNTSTKIKGAA